ncbi:unnamed protein product [Schistosoma turkestanicum]|nr:unnamed protein product [Schistosoma turkestanicum]
MEPESLKLLYIHGNGDILVDYKQRLLHLFYALPSFLRHKLDVLVCPTSPIPAPWDDSPSYVTNCVLPFTCLYNLLGCPAGTLSVGRVEKCDLQVCDNISNDHFKVSPHNMMFSEQHKGSEGLPIGVQVIAKPWNDELALGLLSRLQSILT